MCYCLYLSTDSSRDLTEAKSSLYRFRHVSARDEEPLRALLRYPSLWYLESKYGGCSCHYRHAMEIELGFSEPVDWMPEDPEDLESTEAVYGLFQEIVQAGFALDVIDLWVGTAVIDVDPGDIKSIDVSIQKVAPSEFRFFEGYRFNLVP